VGGVMTVWSDPVDGRVFVALSDEVVLRLTLADARALRDQLADVLGPAVTGADRGRPVPGGGRDRPQIVDRPPHHGDGRRRTAPTGY
jgi:hypothetical protein